MFVKFFAISELELNSATGKEIQQPKSVNK